jgi:hypothetical protein
MTARIGQLRQVILNRAASTGQLERTLGTAIVAGQPLQERDDRPART